jgi:hypothetical protein
MTDLLQDKKRAFAGWPMVIAWVAMLLFALHASTHMVGAGDTWVALACGRHFINHGVDTNEPFSANSHRAGPTTEEIKTWPKWAQQITDKVGLDTVKFWHPTGWVNQNWLTHVIFYWLAYLSPFADGDSWSFNTLVYWKFAIYILTVICVYYTGRVLGVNPALSAVFACAAMFISRSFLDIRPAGFSNLLVAAFILTLVLATYRNHLYIWLLVPATAFWANVHGGYIYVFMMLAPVVVLRLLTMLSKRWTVSLHSILTWLALYLVLYKYTNHEPFTAIAPLHDKLLFLLVLLIAGSVVLASRRSVKASSFYGYHIVVLLVVFIWLVLRLFPAGLVIYSADIGSYVDNCRSSFFMAFLAAIGLGVVVTLLKNRLVATTPAAVWHTMAAGAAAFVASILFNPFHLTNLTHTFQISISPNAEGWRNVHEWWPAFRWDNPVGTAFPFMMMLIAGIGLMTLCLFSRLMAPKQLKGPKTEMESQQKRFNILTRILGFAAAVLIGWSVLISFSFVDVSLSGFLLSGLFVGVLWAAVFINVHCIYIVIPLALFALYTANPAQRYTGRYIFPFITIPCYIVMYIVGAQISKKARFSMVSIFFVLAAAIVALVLEIVLIDPFKFKEPIWNLNQLWGLQRIWAPACEANLETTYTHLFPVLYVINAVCVGVWLAIPSVKGLFGGEAEQAGALEGETYQLPRIDLALITIAVLTMYMAFRSRRFITIAAYVTCPIIAMLIQQVLQTVSASWNFHRRGRLAVSQMPTVLQRWLATGAAAVVIGLGVWWGLKFKAIYMDPWPTETKLTSMFIRMTASHAKPFAATQFITANKLRGNMFNYWTEGGFIAWGQEPDPNGRTPLQLFMDGRAQAAYNYDAYMRWSEVMFGGDIVQRAKIRKQSLTVDDYVQIGEWLSNQLKQKDVWVVLMPSGQFDTPFIHGLERTPNWRLVFINDKEKLYVDISRPRGLELFRGMEDGTTKYPDESMRNIMIANNALVFGTSPESFTKGLECAIKAYEENPTRLAMQMIQVYYDRYPPLRPQIYEYLKRSLNDFEANRKKYLSSDGYYHRIAGALTSIGYLEPIAEKENDKDLVQTCQREKSELMEIANRINDKRW